jgi:hypothetical protein
MRGGDCARGDFGCRAAGGLETVLNRYNVESLNRETEKEESGASAANLAD